MTKPELQARVAALEEELRETTEDLTHEKQIVEGLHEEIAELSTKVEFDPEAAACAVHELLCDEGLVPGDIPWKLGSSYWRQKLIGVLEGFSHDDAPRP